MIRSILHLHRYCPARGHASTRGAGHRRASQGFTLMEVLVALGIFTLGAVAVASIFPVAILLQKETVNSVETKSFGRSAEQLVGMMGFNIPSTAPDSWDDVENDSATAPASGAPDVVSPLPATAFDGWSIADRSYNSSAGLESRTVFWVPLIYDADDANDVYNWRLFLFVVRGRLDQEYYKRAPFNDPNSTDIAGWADDNSTYTDPVTSIDGDPVNDQNPASTLDDVPGVPGVARINTSVSGTNTLMFDNDPRIVFPGDEIVGEDGVIYTVLTSDPGQVTVNGVLPAPGAYDVWAAHPGYGPNTGTGTVSSFVKLFTFIDENGNLIQTSP